MGRSLMDILIKPNSFFQEIMTEKESFTLPVLIVLVAGIMGAATAYMMSKPIAQMMAGAVPGIEILMSFGTVIGAILITFLFWIGWSGIIFALSYAFKGQGTFKRTLECVGYGYLPQIIGSIITLIIAFDYIPKVNVPQLTTTGMQDPVILEQTIKILMQDPAMVEFTQIMTLLSIVFLLWSANIWIFGIQHSRKLSTRDAALCVGIPVVIFTLYSIYKLGAL